MSDLLLTKTLLLVEDDVVALRLLTMAMQRRFGTVLIAEDGAKGLALFNEHRPDIVITDVEMPWMGGLEMMERIKAISPTTPVVIVTAFEDEVVGVTKADAIFIKPVRNALLLEKLESLLRPQ